LVGRGYGYLAVGSPYMAPHDREADADQDGVSMAAVSAAPVSASAS